MAATLIFTVTHRPVEIRTLVQTASAQPIDDIVKKAVAETRAQTRAEDAQLFNARLEASEAKHDKEHRYLVEALAVMQQSLNTNVLMASSATSQTGAGQ